MCDTLVAVHTHTVDGKVWFAKNSDREPGEAQVVEHLPRTRQRSSTLQCTYLEIPQVASTNEIVLSRPFWMWGAEIGANEHGLTIGNEAVWTRLSIAKVGITGMDLLRLALERTSTAREALELITTLMSRYEQGGECGYRNKKFRYHNSFIIADPSEAWVLETAGRFWVAERVRGVRTISNVLTIGREFDLLGKGTYEYARSRGWCKSSDDFDFARSFSDPAFRRLTGGVERRACTLKTLRIKKVGHQDFLTALRDHNGMAPASGWKMTMPCAHSSWMKTRRAGQTTGSMISRLDPRQSTHWLTGTSSPCLSVFKPIILGKGEISTGPLASRGYDDNSLFWRHEKLHRLVLRDYESRSQVFRRERMELEVKSMLDAAREYSADECQSYWGEHLAAIEEWRLRVESAAAGKRRFSLFDRYWAKQDELDRPPVSIPE